MDNRHNYKMQISKYIVFKIVLITYKVVLEKLVYFMLKRKFKFVLYIGKFKPFSKTVNGNYKSLF